MQNYIQLNLQFNNIRSLDPELRGYQEEKESYEAGTTIISSYRRFSGHWIALVCSNMNPAAIQTADRHTAAVGHIGQQWYIFSPCFVPESGRTNKIRLQEVPGIANIRHLLEVMRGGKSKYSGVDNGNGYGSARRGYSVSNIWVTGVGDKLYQCQSLSAVFVQEFIAGMAGAGEKGLVPGGLYTWMAAKL